MKSDRTDDPSASHDRAALAVKVADALLGADRASQALGMKLESVGLGEARVSMRVRADMLNGHGLCHGGLLFTLADSAFAFACNSHGDNAVAAGASIDFLAPARLGDDVIATAKELWRGGRSGLYEVSIVNQAGTQLALFRGRSHRIAGRVLETVSGVEK